jgi:tetratricopeptide (TPR) repeat protein
MFDKDAALNEAVEKTIAKFMKMIAPYNEFVTVKFCTPGPFKPAPDDLKQGENLAKAGRWENALQQFKSVTQNRPTDNCAWYDLGIACLYANEFKEAENAFNEANKIASCPDCLEQINNVKRRAEEIKKLEAQGAL